MGLSIEQYYALGLMLLFLLKALLVSRYTTFQAYNLYLNAAFFLLIAVFLAYEFWQDGLYTGILAIVLGGLAMGKYLSDMQAPREEEDQDPRGFD
jgi:predicted membrane protein